MTGKQQYHSLRELVTIARNKHNIGLSTNLADGTEILKTFSYYTLVNGYQRALEKTRQSEVFVDGITLNTLSTIQITETFLASDILSAIFSFEKQFKTILQDVIGNSFGIKQSEYLNYKHYKSTDNLDRIAVIKKLNLVASVQRQVSNSLLKYRDAGNVPPWILVSDLTFGQLLKWYSVLPGKLKNTIIESFNLLLDDQIEAKEFFSLATEYIRQFRNGLAHGNLINKIRPSVAIHYELLHKLHPEVVINRIEYEVDSVGKRDLYGLLLVLFPLLPRQYLNSVAQNINHHLNQFNTIMPLYELPMQRLLSVPMNVTQRIEMMKA